VVVVQTPSTGCSVYVVASGGLPDVWPDHAEVAEAMGDTLTIGTTHATKVEIKKRAAAAFMTEPAVEMSPESVALRITGPAAALDAMLSVLSDVASDASFPQQDFQYAMDAAVRAAEAEQRTPTWLADKAFSQAVFGRHPYAATFSPERLAKVTRAEVAALYARVFDPSRLTVFVAASEDVQSLFQKVERYFGGPRRPPRATPPAVPAPKVRADAPRLVVVDVPGTSRAEIVQGVAGPPGGAAEIAATRAGFYALSSGGRLTRRLGDDLGEVGHITPRLTLRRAASSFGWSTQTARENIATVLRESDRTVRTYLQEGPTDTEFEGARNTLTLSQTSLFTTSRGVLDQYSRWFRIGIEPDQAAKAPAQAGAVTRDEAVAALHRTLDPDRLTTVVVGDWTSMREAILGLGWGPVEVRDRKLALVRTEGTKRP
jgi:zinc protease